jgi:FkbM family methyltransferase
MGSTALRDRVLRTSAGRRLRSVRRAFEPEHITRDREDNAHLRALLATVLRPDSTCVDVGAHAGAVLAEMVRLAPDGHHHAFEPLPDMAAALAARFPQVEVHRLALSDTRTTREFVHMVDDPGWSGFVQRPTPGGQDARRITVQTAPLDEVLPPGTRVDVLKIDVEGAELEVLRGARETIARDRPVIALEHGLGSADFYGTSPDSVFALLADAGLRVFTLAGDGPLDAAGFAATFHTGRAVNFVAHP